MKESVIITGAGTATCQGVIKALRAQDEIDVRLIVTDPDTQTAGRYLADVYERVPLAGDPSFVDRLLEIVKNYDADLLIPIVDMEFLPIARRRLEFPCALSMSEESVLINCLEKDRTAKIISGLGLKHPRVIPHDTPRPDNEFPLYVKPRIGRASLDCYRVDNPAELAVALSKVDDPLVSEFVEGTEMTIDTLCDLEGQWLGGCVRARVETKSGVSVKGVVVHNGRILSEARQIVEALGMTGPACLQCFNTPDGPVWFEVNPRFGGGTILSIAAGLNSPLMLLKSALGLPPGEFQPTGTLRMIRYWQEVFVDVGGQQTTLNVNRQALRTDVL